MNAGDRLAVWLTGHINVGHLQNAGVIAANEQFVLAEIIQRDDATAGGGQESAADVLSGAVSRGSPGRRGGVGRLKGEDISHQDVNVKERLVVADDTGAAGQVVSVRRQV